MVDFDLRTLSAPVESLRSEVNAAYKRLDAKWGEIASCLAKLPIPCTISYCVQSDDLHPEQGELLEWRKWRGKRRLCITDFYVNMHPELGPTEAEDVTPYEEWSAEQRIEMLQYVPAFFDAAVEQVQKFIDRTRGSEASL